MPETLEERYRRLCATPSEINEHLPTLRRLAKECESVVEFGTETCKSATAFLMGGARLLSVDWLQWGNIDDLKREIAIMETLGQGRFRFHQSNTLEIGIFDRCDLLFIDSLHTTKHVLAELQTHGYKAQKYLVFHDTSAPFGAEVRAAIECYQIQYPDLWETAEVYINNHGLTVLRRR